ncbi:DUF1642 domain-containing protein [uncultured Lactococcus sp.]|uniref:DUF1642 domain-containing protein n=1 Tax=uncultured Lactococcus sp. TaxID=167973 RepID=UPI0027DDEFA0|nr:DUF1642 domain-containing protein [uncultured Lactococcus sp.]
MRKYKEYIGYLEQELEKSRDLECQANNQASYEYILKCEVETLLKEKQEQIVALKSRLDSQQPELPDFVAKDIEEFRKHIETVGLLYYEDFMSHETLDWIIDIRNHAAFMQALSTGEYKVSKEKRFYLKNKLTGLYLCESKKGFFEQENPTLELTRRCDFSQQEIDNMDTGSYEQIEVEE